MAELLAQTLYEAALSRYGDRIAVIDGDRRVSYADLDMRTRRLANALGAHGASLDRPVATFLPNCVEFVEADVACTRGGFTRVGVSDRLSGDECAYILEDSTAAVLVTTSALLETFDVLPSTLRSIFVVSAGAGERLPVGALRFDDVLSGASARFARPRLQTSTPNYVLYTSGTTGRPKGALHTQGGRYAATMNMLNAELELDVSSVMVHAAPLTHGSGSKLIAVLASGGCNLILRRFDVEEFANAVRRERGTHSFFVPTMLQRLTEAVSGGLEPALSLQQISFGGAPISINLFERSVAALGPILTEVYGSCEAPHPVTILKPADYEGRLGRERLESAGRPPRGVELRIVDGEGDVPVGGIGELLVRAPHLMARYWSNAKATAEALTADGWYRTGDLAQIDGEGFMHLVDRKRDLIISGGLNIYPSEVERVLLQHPGVREAAVIGYPDDEWGESVCAYIVVRDGHEPIAGDLVDWCRDRLASYKKPRQVVFVDTLPTGSSNKVLKNELRAVHWAGRERLIN